jgi:competence protein ComEC
MTPGQGRPFALDAGWIAALCGGVLAQLLAPALLPHGLAVGLVVFAFAALALARQLARRASASGGDALSVALAWLAAFALGAGLCAMHGEAALDRRPPAVLDGTAVRLDVRVVGLSDFRQNGARFTADIERVIGASEEVTDALATRRIALDWYGGGRSLRSGEVWRFAVRLRPWSRPMNPGDPDEARRALLAGIDAQGVVLASDRPLRLGAPGGLHALRGSISDRIIEALGGERARFVAALAVGDTRGLSDDDWERLRQFGLTHLIAISGFHVGMVAGLGVVLVRLFWWWWPTLAHRMRRRPAAAAAALAVATAYAALAGFSLPTVRTVLMIGVVAFVIGRRRRSPSAQPLLLAMALLGMSDPFALLTPGFWLSCGGVAWLLWCLPGTADPWSPRTFLKAQWVATLGLLPLGAAFFLQVPVAGPLANLVAIPWISLIVVPLSLLGTLLMPVSETLSTWVWQGAAAAMDAFWWAMGQVPQAWSSSRWLPEVSAGALALAVLGVAIVLLPRGIRWRFAGALLVLPLLFPPLTSPPPGEFSVTAFALPRGDALLVRTTTRTVLVDAGPESMDLARRLRAAGVESIDLRIETRRNAGRFGGAASVDRAFVPRHHWRAPGTTASVRGPLRCEAGRRWAAEDVVIEALSPTPEAAGAWPDEACVLRVSSASGRVAWLTSDAGRWVAHRLASPSAGAWVIGAPATLGDWRAALGASGGIATRAPGPSLDRRWPDDLHRVDREGALTWHSSASDAPARARNGPTRWWHPGSP